MVDDRLKNLPGGLPEELISRLADNIEGVPGVWSTYTDFPEVCRLIAEYSAGQPKPAPDDETFKMALVIEYLHACTVPSTTQQEEIWKSLRLVMPIVKAVLKSRPPEEWPALPRFENDPKTPGAAGGA